MSISFSVLTSLSFTFPVYFLSHPTSNCFQMKDVAKQNYFPSKLNHLLLHATTNIFKHFVALVELFSVQR